MRPWDHHSSGSASVPTLMKEVGAEALDQSCQEHPPPRSFVRPVLGERLLHAWHSSGHWHTASEGVPRPHGPCSVVGKAGTRVTATASTRGRGRRPVRTES